MDRDVRAVLTTSAYGAVIGAAAGLATWPLSGSSRSVFIGASVGLYLGIVAGVYFITHRDDPQNPMAGEPVPPPRLGGDPMLSASTRLAPAPDFARLEIPVYHF